MAFTVTIAFNWFKMVLVVAVVAQTSHTNFTSVRRPGLFVSENQKHHFISSDASNKVVKVLTRLRYNPILVLMGHYSPHQRGQSPTVLYFLMIVMLQQRFSTVQGLLMAVTRRQWHCIPQPSAFYIHGRMQSAFVVTGEKISTSASIESHGDGVVSPHDASSEPAKVPVWNHPTIRATVAKKKRNNNARFRQHVNPLSRMYQQPTVLPQDWPVSVYHTLTQRPLHLDIGCGKGGFLIDLCQRQQESIESDNNIQPAAFYNFLGLEIRPGVAAYAKDRIAVHQLQGQLDFLGCNANVDLDRILDIYQSHYRPNDIENIQAMNELCLHRVTIQFPDPHFKNQHIKRRVVTGGLVETLAKYMPPEADVILQSDVKLVLDDMRQQFRSADSKDPNCLNECYFTDSVPDIDQYISENSLGVPTEREQSVINQDLPVYRSLLRRSHCPYP